MTDTRSDTVSVVDRTHPVAAGAPIVAAHFLGHTAVFVLGEEAMLLVEPKGEPRRVAVHGGAILATAADDKRIISGGDDGKVVATDAAGRNPHPCHRRKASLDRSRRARTRRRGRLVRRQDRVRAGQGTARIRSALHRRRRLPSCPKASGSPSPITTAPRCGFRMRRRPRRKSSNGRARISAPPSVPTAASSSPPCRSRCCTAGGSPTASTCACRVTPRA